MPWCPSTYQSTARVRYIMINDAMNGAQNSMNSNSQKNHMLGNSRRK
jgi:hypothetical protein